jgi:hypothetical protein
VNYWAATIRIADYNGSVIYGGVVMNMRFFTISLLNFFTAIVEGFLALRFLLKLFGANPLAGFVDWVYAMSGVLLEPFRGIFGVKVLDNRYVLEFSTLFAMLMYAILALLLIALINLIAAAPGHRDALDDEVDDRPARRGRRLL